MGIVNSSQLKGRFLVNLLHFARLLRRLGLPVSSSQVSELAEALTYIDFYKQEDFYYTARAFLVKDVEQYDLFTRFFHLFWARSVEWVIEFGLSKKQPRKYSDELDLPESEEQGIPDQHLSNLNLPKKEEPLETLQDVNIAGKYSPIEILRKKDFASFTEDEIVAVNEFIRAFNWNLDQRLSRRKVRASKRANYIDFRRAFRGNMKYGGEIIHLSWSRRKRKSRPLILICDVSGSMEKYSRLFLQLFYTLVQEKNQIETFVFGTRLTRITHALKSRDLDTALKRTSDLVMDWSGGTRIGESLMTFNYHWSRRVLGRGAVVVVVSDGWDRGDIELLRKEISRLHRSVSRLIWLNPLSGAQGYQPLVRGIQAILPYVDEFLPLHNLESLEQFAHRLGSISNN